MKTVSAIVSLALAAAAGETRAATSIEHSDLNGDVVVIGQLGVPLGRVVEIEATIVSGDSLGTKGDGGRYFLQITRVGDETLTTTPICEFEFRPGTRLGETEIAAGVDALYELKTGRKAGSLTAKQVEDLEQDYLGRKYRLLAFETGGFSGIPRNMPRDYAQWQDHGFGFSTFLVVLRVLE